jgi:hypothetical protein
MFSKLFKVNYTISYCENSIILCHFKFVSHFHAHLDLKNIFVTKKLILPWIIMYFVEFATDLPLHNSEMFNR